METVLPSSCRRLAFLLCVLFCSVATQAQTSSRSLLINHGGVSCGNDSAEDHFFAGALTANPTLAFSCVQTLPYYFVYTAYNPADHKIYFADVSGFDTKVFALDYNLAVTPACPSFETPTYVYDFTLNQLCFDNLGNNYGISNFDPANRTASLMQVDIATGAGAPGTGRTLKFPVDRLPNSLGEGDIVILPNGRMFATFGSAPSTLYEMTNPSSGDTVNVTFLTALPKPCYSIGFVDGSLAMAGSDTSGCYYYTWDINSLSLSAAHPYPLNKTSADMTNLTAAIGSAKKIIGVGKVNANTATVIYQIVVKNKGNILLNNVQLTDDLEAVFGSGNVQAAKLSFVSNPAGIQLNPAYNGTTDKNLFALQQTLNNYPAAIDSVVINLEVTATNLIPGVYYNSAVASGSIGAGTSMIVVSDSTNNGGADRIDLDRNDVSDDAGENTPTPLTYSVTLPATGVVLKGKTNGGVSRLTWSIPANETYSRFEVERSEDGRNFKKLTTLFTAGNFVSYNDDAGNLETKGLHYRIKAFAANNTVVYSNTVYLQFAQRLRFNAHPNPFRDAVTFEFESKKKNVLTLLIKDVAGRTLASNKMIIEKGANQVKWSGIKPLQPGVYVLEVTSDGESVFAKLVKQ